MLDVDKILNDLKQEDFTSNSIFLDLFDKYIDKVLVFQKDNDITNIEVYFYHIGKLDQKYYDNNVILNTNDMDFPEDIQFYYLVDGDDNLLYDTLPLKNLQEYLQEKRLEGVPELDIPIDLFLELVEHVKVPRFYKDAIGYNFFASNVSAVIDFNYFEVKEVREDGVTLRRIETRNFVKTVPDEVVKRNPRKLELLL